MPLRIVTTKLGVIWQGAFFTYHSLALVNRELTLALLETDRFHIGVREQEPVSFSPNANPRFKPLAERLGTRPADPFLTVRHFWPPCFDAADTPRLVLMQPWEFGSLPRDWVRGIAESVDEVWAYTRYVREVYVNSGVPAEKVAVVPLGVNTAHFHPQVEPLALPTKKSFKFLFVGGTISRKGIDVLLRAYEQAFTHRDDVSLIIKDFGARTFYAGQDAATLIRTLQAKFGAPEIVYLTDDMPEEQIAQLYAACDCLVHPYRGEGFGLPIAEAMACGKPTVVTNFGAALDFANPENAYLIPARVVHLEEKRIGPWETVDYPFWAEPDGETLVATLRHIYENPAQARARGERAAQDMASKFTWAHSAAAAAKRMEVLSAKHTTVSLTPPIDVAGIEARKQEALRITRSGDWSLAIAKLEACLQESPGDWDLLNALSVALFRTGEVERAKQLMQDGIDRAPNARDFHHNLAFVLLSEGDSITALEHACRAFVYTPDSPEIRRTLQRARDLVLSEARRYRHAAKKPARLSGQNKPPKDDTYRRWMAAVARADALLAGNIPQDKSLALPPVHSHNAPNQKPSSPPVVDHGANLAPHAARRTPRLSIVMIAKDEERFLRGCLESVWEVADEIVLVDTGSSDATAQIALEFGAKVISHPWNEDFSEARNVSLAHATGDWALWIDADERLAQGHADLLRYLIENAEPNVGGYMVNIRNIMREGEEPEVFWHRACRLFRLLPTVRFRGRIHEQNLPSIQEAGYVCAMSQLTLDHYGYVARVMDDRDKHERFIRMLTREVTENPHSPEHNFHLFNLGNAYYTRGDMENAIRWLEQAGAHPNPAEEYTAMLFIEWATALYSTGRAEEALRVCERAEAIGIVHPGLHFAWGHTWIHLRKYEEAAHQFQKAIEQGRQGLFVHMGDVGAYTYKAFYGLALAATGQDRYEEATEYARQALSMKVEFVDARYLLAHALRRLGRHTEARQEFQTLLQSMPEHELALMELGELLYEMGDYATAIPYLRTATLHRPMCVEAWFRRAYCAEQLSLLEEARDAYLAVRKLAPKWVEPCVNLGRVYSALGEDERALECFSEAMALDPQNANTFFCTADVLYKLGFPHHAADSLCVGLQLEPTRASGFLVLGNCYVQTGDYAAALEAYRQALALQPHYPEAQNNLALAESLLNAKSEAA